jgi:hypothetical protein
VLAFCAILSGGLVLERFLALVRERRNWEMLVGAGLLAVLAWHLAMCRPSFYTYGFEPYPELPAEFETAFHPYGEPGVVGDKNSRRIASWAELRSVSPDHYAALFLNLPHHYQVPSVFGYDPVVEGQAHVKEAYRRLDENPLEACRRYGVGWHLFSDGPVHSPNARFYSMERAIPNEAASQTLRKADLPMVARFGGITLKELPGVDPLAFATERPERPLPMRLSCRGADIDVAGLEAGTRVTVNFLWHPHMTLQLDGQPLEVEQDDWQRITTTLPASGEVLALRFEPPWAKTCAVGAALCLAALVLAWRILRRRHGPVES